MTGNDVAGTGNDVTGTGSDRKCGGHVIWDGKPLTSGKKGSWAKGTGSHMIWSRKPLTSRENGMAGSGTADQRGLRVQSPIQTPGGGIKRQPYWLGDCCCHHEFLHHPPQ